MTPRKRYLFIRILEACNADCFMCGYALSRDRYRFRLAEFEAMLPVATALGIRFVRFTGGEPLLHKEVEAMIAAGTRAGMAMSIITNGHLLPSRVERLAEIGLAQVIVSIDGASAATHDAYRNTPDLFARCVEGLARARELGVRTRVNTVVGPHNYAEMPALQERLSALGVEQWELSAIKLERRIAYDDPEHVRAVGAAVYDADPSTTLVPMGKRFYGESPEEQRRFFDTGTTPRPKPPRCHLVGDVVYLDAKNGRGYGCSLLPHRDDEQSGGGAVLRRDGAWTLDTPELDHHVRTFRDTGPTVCQGCSTTAAGYSDLVASGAPVEDWAF